MTLKELYEKIGQILEETPSWANVERIGIVHASYEDGSKDMEWLKDFHSICCDGQGMVAFQLVMEDDEYYD